ncbi:DUF1294 domain-containing protein [Halobacillus hunanensis]|uniref:DUF1294 domain-containing protein n=1 Tax=Halobacillus hunanensis TaxID=578214 RepID=UPI00111678DB|nr:DUF1294 domain-containing protein [Halobacillus hunanensis]
MVVFYWVLFVFILSSTALFILMGYDKSKARKRQWRVSEKRLWFLALTGGACGGAVGIKVFRHKANYSRFSIGWPIIAVIQLLGLFTLMWFYFP